MTKEKVRTVHKFCSECKTTCYGVFWKYFIFIQEFTQGFIQGFIQEFIQVFIQGFTQGFTQGFPFNRDSFTFCVLSVRQ